MKFNTLSSIAEPASTTREVIPWWSDLDQITRHALDIPTAENDKAAYQRLIEDNYDLIVVGAGVAGLAATLEASLLGLKVLCLDSGSKIGLGATGRNAGILCTGINMPIACAPQGKESGRLWRETAVILQEIQAKSKLAGSLVQVTQRGGLGLARSKTAVKRLQQEAIARTDAGLKAVMLTTSDVAKMTDGRLSLQDVQAAICYPDEGSIQPLTLLAQLAHEARLAGAQFVGGATVVEAQEKSAKGNTAESWQINLQNGRTLHARFLIKAVGPTARPSSRIYALSFAMKLPLTFPLFWDAAPYIYYDFRAGDGRLTASGGRYAKVGGGRDEHYFSKMAAAARYWLPELQNQKPLYKWAVDIEVAHDLVPHLTPLGQSGNALAIEGLGALGVLPGVVLARQAARRLAKGQ